MKQLLPKRQNKAATSDAAATTNKAATTCYCSNASSSASLALNSKLLNAKWPHRCSSFSCFLLLNVL